MKALWRGWLRRLRHVGKAEGTEFAEEIESNLQLHVDDNIRRGMTPGEARRQAVLKFGGIEAAKESYRDQRSVRWIENLAQDTYFAARQMARHRGCTATAVLILSLGISASVAIFAFVHAGLIQPLPYREPARLAGVFAATRDCPVCQLSYLDFRDWKARTQTVEQLEGFRAAAFHLRTASGLERAEGVRVTAGFFRLLGVRPALGRDFADGEDKPGSAMAVLITHRAWRNRFDGRGDIAGQRVVLNDVPGEIAGVLPEDFHFALTGSAEFYQVLVPGNGCEQRRGCHTMYAAGRLKQGVAVEAASAEFARIAMDLEREHPDSNRGQGGMAEPLSESIGGALRPVLLMLLGGVCLILAIAWTNVASLLLIRSEARGRELTVRRALGAPGIRLVSQFAAEGLALVAIATACGLALAHALIRVLHALIPEFLTVRMPSLRGAGLLHADVLAFAAAVSGITLFVVVLTPVAHMALDARPAWNRWRGGLVVAQLGIAVVLLTGAGLLAKSLNHLFQVDLGFRPEGLVSLEVAVPPEQYDSDAKLAALRREILERVTGLPGVAAAGLSGQALISDLGNTTWLYLAGGSEKIDLPERSVSPEYFAAVGATLRSGRSFEAADDREHPRVVIVNRTFAEHYFPGRDAAGMKLLYHRPNATPMEIVGVVDDLREGQLDSGNRPVLYIPMAQEPDTFLVVTARVSEGGASLRDIAGALRTLHRDIVVYGAATMEDRTGKSRSAHLHRSSAWLVGGLAALALLLSAVGLSGVVGYSVSQRTREIGVRMALGAGGPGISTMILRQAAGLALAGLAGGAAAAVALASLARSVLFGVQPWDVPALLSAALVLAVATLAASYFPARRAAAVNPVEALRAQ